MMLVLLPEMVQAMALLVLFGRILYFCPASFLATGKCIFLAECSSSERGSAFFLRNALPRNGEAHFSSGMLFRKTGKRIFLAECSSSERGSAFFLRNALPRNGEVYFSCGMLSLGTGKHKSRFTCCSHGVSFLFIILNRFRPSFNRPTNQIDSIIHFMERHFAKKTIEGGRCCLLMLKKQGRMVRSVEKNTIFAP